MLGAETKNNDFFQRENATNNQGPGIKMNGRIKIKERASKIKLIKKERNLLKLLRNITKVLLYLKSSFVRFESL